MATPRDRPVKAGRPQAALIFALRARCATTFSIIRMPASPPSVMIDSGWNCTAAIGSLACSMPMIVPSSLSAVMMKSRGRRRRIGKDRVVAADGHFLGEAGEDDARLQHADARRLAVHRQCQMAQLAAIGLGERLQAEADAEDRQVCARAPS